jgi:hypothetical protein
MDWVFSVAKSVASAELPDEVIDQIKRVDFCGTESQCLDFKRDGYKSTPIGLAEAVKDIASFHNTFGGFIIFGVHEVEKDVRHHVTGVDGTPFQMQMLRGKIESWLESDVAISYDEIEISDGLRIGILFIPKRMRAVPNRFKKRGPEIASNRYAFDAGTVAFRRGDSSTIAKEVEDWQLVLSDRSLDSVIGELGRLATMKRSGAALDHNLPTRDIICPKFVGRSDVLKGLWSWLNDEFQYAKVIAGEGGNGKTSVAYEFATQVAHNAPLEIERIVWLTAKKKQFLAADNSWQAMPETHFDDFISLLYALALNLGYMEIDFQDSSEVELMRSVRSEIKSYPTLFILDDIDSLSPDDQRRVLEFAQQVGSDTVRFLLTTRSNASYSSAAAITLKGLSGQDYLSFLSILIRRYGIELSQKDMRKLERATCGSPLLTDSILRVVRRGNDLSRAIKDWKKHSGEDARNAVLGREIDQLSRSAKRALLCLGFLKDASKSEIMNAGGFLEISLEDSLEELRSLFIVSASRIIESEPRYSISEPTALLVLSKMSHLAGDHIAIERKVQKMRSKVKRRTSSRKNKNVAIAISQALSLRKSDISAARETIEAALKIEKNHPDLLLFKGRMIMETESNGSGGARRLFEEAYRFGARKHILFDLWYKCERDASNGAGVLDVASMALSEFSDELVLWSKRKAEGYVINGIARSKKGDFDLACDDLSSAAKETHTAQENSSGSNKVDLSEDLYLLHDSLIRTLPSTSDAYRRETISLLREITDRGDLRRIVLSAFTEAIERRFGALSRNRSIDDSAISKFENNLRYLVDILRSAGLPVKDLLERIDSLSYWEQKGPEPRGSR